MSYKTEETGKYIFTREGQPFGEPTQDDIEKLGLVELDYEGETINHMYDQRTNENGKIYTVTIDSPEKMATIATTIGPFTVVQSQLCTSYHEIVILKK